MSWIRTGSRLQNVARASTQKLSCCSKSRPNDTWGGGHNESRYPKQMGVKSRRLGGGLTMRMKPFISCEIDLFSSSRVRALGEKRHSNGDTP